MPSRRSLRYAAGGTALAAFAAAAPCDIYASGNTPCVAAHGTTRALYDNYNGPLYQVQRGSDNSTKEIMPLSAGGVADASSQDSFCDGTSCEISVIYDQSGNANDLTRAPPGGAASGPAPGGYDALANATMAPVTLNGKKAYGVYGVPGVGYRNDQTSGIATGDEPEGIYAVLDGTRYNGGCCYDYGNAEVNNLDNGAGHMETVYFGLGTGYGTGAGDGPWILADLENGLYSEKEVGVNENDPSIDYRFVTAIVKGGNNHWAIRGGNAKEGTLGNFFEGEHSADYNPLKKEGAIILGIGGDNSNWAIGTFYEGVMTTGYPDDATEDAVQKDIVAAGYAA